jgi:hypothetical protein
LPYIVAKHQVVKTIHLMKQLFLVLLSAFILVSCQKEVSYETPVNGGGGGGGGNNSYFIQAKVNGTTKTFNFNNAAIITDLGGGVKSLSLVGNASSNASSLEGINLAINFMAIAPKTGTYTEDYSGTDYVTAAVYNPNSTTVVYGAGLIATSVSPLNITITKIDNTVVSGTFKGAFYKLDISSGNPSSTEYLDFTDGSFNLPVR